MSDQGETKFHSITIGDHPDVEMVWLHGWGHDHSAFVPLARLFERKAKNTLFDLPGFGQSPMLAEGAGSGEYATALGKHLGPKGKKRILIGHSFGCRVALQLAAANPGFADAYILIAAAGLKRKRGIAWRMRAWSIRMLGRLAGMLDRIFNTKFKTAYAHRFGSSDYRNAGALRATFVSVVNEDLSDIAARVNEPVLLIFGSEDDETPPEFGARYAQLIKSAELKTLDGYNHLDILGRGAHQVQTLINRFLEK